MELTDDGWCRVQDNGRGIPTGIHPTEGIDTLQLVMTSLHAGGKFDHDSYSESAGLHGVGVSAVNAVSSALRVDVWREGRHHHQTYSCGVPLGPVEEGEAPDAAHGTAVAWQRDLSIFSGATEYDRAVLRRRLEELAFLNPGLMIDFTDFRGGKEIRERFHFVGGIPTFLERLVEKRGALFPVFHFTDGRRTEVALTWTKSNEEDLRCYANNTYNQDGGTHSTGFKNGLTRAITKYAKEHGLLEKLKEGITGSDIREGLVAIVSMKIQDLSFSSQTKDKLVSPQAKTLVENLFADQIEPWLEANPGIAKKIAEKAVLSARAREAARRARDEVLRKDFGDRLSLPGKLADCQTKKAAEAEIFIVEGDSAGGSAKAGRDRRFQAILPLRGKVLNVERAGMEAVLQNGELHTLITALGCGVELNNSYNPQRLRYHKVVIMTDADVDGAHIRTLLLTFFYRCMPRLIADGHLFIALPPLYGARIKSARTERYFGTEADLEEWIQSLPEHRRGLVKLTRYKGLGEMNPEDLWSTTLDPEARTLRSVTIEDAVEAERAFGVLMGEDVEHRRAWIEDNALLAVVDV